MLAPFIDLTFYMYIQTFTMRTLRIFIRCAFGCLLASLLSRYTDTGRELNIFNTSAEQEINFRNAWNSPVIKV